MNMLLLIKDSLHLKKAGFKKIIINPSGNYTRTYNYSFPDVDDIPEDALIQLRDFILQQRTELHDPTFCNTIYTAVFEKLE